MTWNYRVVRIDFEDESEYGIYEVYYDAFGQPIARTENPIAALGEDMNELRHTMYAMSVALDEPVLTDEDFFYG